MIHLNSLHTITFAQRSVWKRQYELLEGETVLGRLSFPSIFSDVGWCSQEPRLLYALREKLKVESGERCWILEKKGILNINLTVRLPDAKKPIATIPLKLKRGMYTIKLPRYRSVRLVTNLMKSEYVLKTTMNTTLCTLKLQRGPRLTGDLVIEKKEDFLPEYPWLVYVVAYIALLGQRNSA
jgi:hypothetical protein